jgi:hypothetical protein
VVRYRRTFKNGGLSVESSAEIDQKVVRVAGASEAWKLMNPSFVTTYVTIAVLLRHSLPEIRARHLGVGEGGGSCFLSKLI